MALSTLIVPSVSTAQLSTEATARAAGDTALDAEKVTWSEGTLAARPSAAAAFAAAGGPVLYLATDDNGGTTYKTHSGTAWVQIAGSVTPPGQTLLGRFRKRTGNQSNSTTTLADLTDLTSMTLVGNGVDTEMRISMPWSSTVTNNRLVFVVVDDLGATVFAAPAYAAPATNAVPVYNATMTLDGPTYLPSGTTRVLKAQFAQSGGGSVTVSGTATAPSQISFWR